MNTPNIIEEELKKFDKRFDIPYQIEVHGGWFDVLSAVELRDYFHQSLQRVMEKAREEMVNSLPIDEKLDPENELKNIYDWYNKNIDEMNERRNNV
jgi:hypothetical protein